MMAPCRNPSQKFLAKWTELANLKGKFRLKQHAFNIPVWIKSMEKVHGFLRHTLGKFLHQGFDIIIEDE